VTLEEVIEKIAELAEDRSKLVRGELYEEDFPRPDIEDTK
jgi:hypothetical protein